MRRAVARGAADEVAVVGLCAEARPDLLAVDHEVFAIALGLGGQAGEVAAGVRLAHADAPSHIAGEHLGQVAVRLFLGAVLDERGAHLTVGEPGSGDGRADLDHLLGNDEAVNGGSTPTAELLGPRHSDEGLGGEFLGELFRVAVHPAVVPAAVPLNPTLGDLAGPLAEFVLFWRPGEVHRSTDYGTPPTTPTSILRNEFLRPAWFSPGQTPRFPGQGPDTIVQ
ncbi:unannotated protein [freshwater metagenome]|uniref:Unannotated protein n=1 Tax=freshwater metagenome TaxID=449393 RepID=A0A6J6XRJ0_9ZZZZ